MKHSTLLISATLIVAFSAIVFIGCQKNEDNTITNNGQPTTFSLQGDEAIASILNFRKQVEAYKKNPTMKSSETMSIAEAIWNIENLFNLTYAAPEEYYSETEEFEFSLYLPIDAQGEVLETDLFALYEQAIAAARTGYANTSFTEKGFLLMAVEIGDQTDNTVRLDFNGKAGDRCAINQWQYNVIHFGPFGYGEDWQYKRGMGKCVGTCLESGADEQLEMVLQDYISSLLEVSEEGYRPVYLNRALVTFTGRDIPNGAFYREDTALTCIDSSTMNYLYGREKITITQTIPNDPFWQVEGCFPVDITIEGRCLDPEGNKPLCITHENHVTYTQRIIASISEVGEKQNLLDY